MSLNGSVGASNPPTGQGKVDGREIANYAEDQGPQIITSDCVGSQYLVDESRRRVLEHYCLEDALILVCDYLNQLDRAECLGRASVRKLEIGFLESCTSEESKQAFELVRTGRCLFSSATLIRLVREIIEWCSEAREEDRVEGGSISPPPPDLLLRLILSINKSQVPEMGFSDDISPEQLAQALDEISKDQSRMKELESQMKLWELARLQTNAVVVWDVLLSDAFETWFKPWPKRAVYDLIGETPEAAFSNATGAQLSEVIRLGRHLWLRGQEGALKFATESLIESQFSSEAVDLLVESASLTLREYRKRLVGERKQGDVSNRRYTFAQFPILKLDKRRFLMLRSSWVADRLCGQQLYWQTFSGFGGAKDVRAKQFSWAMDQVFERNVDYLLRRLRKKAPENFVLINEVRMQEEWGKRSGPPSVCDWVVQADDVCVLLDANNHRLDFHLAQGLADESHYVEDLEKSILKKCGQFRSTAVNLRENGWGSSEVGQNTLFVPLIVVPNAGLPMTSLTDLDLAERAAPILEGAGAYFTTPGVVTWQDLQILEGLIDSHSPFGFTELLVAWRKSCTWEFPVRLQTFWGASGFRVR